MLSIQIDGKKIKRSHSIYILSIQINTKIAKILKIGYSQSVQQLQIVLLCRQNEIKFSTMYVLIDAVWVLDTLEYRVK